jgi:hypothetical protein
MGWQVAGRGGGAEAAAGPAAIEGVWVVLRLQGKKGISAVQLPVSGSVGGRHAVTTAPPSLSCQWPGLAGAVVQRGVAAGGVGAGGARLGVGVADPRKRHAGRRAPAPPVPALPHLPGPFPYGTPLSSPPLGWAGLGWL